MSIIISLNAADLSVNDLNQSVSQQHSETTIKDIGWGLLVAVAIPVYIVGGIVYYITLVPIGIVAYTADSLQK